MNSPTPELSIVIPAYNEQDRLPPTLARVRAWIDAAKISTEVIVVDDGSQDFTAAVVANLSADWPELRILVNPGNHGKGYSVRHGALEARGRIVLFTDADLSAPIEEADKLLAALATHDIAIGSRALDRRLISVHQSKLREFAGIVFNMVVRVVLGLPFSDTQCGFKAFMRAPCTIVFQQQRIERFGFDPELLFIAKRHGLTIAEVPVRWAHDPGTRVAMLRDSLKMFAEVLGIRWNAILRRYPK
jgi:glycosyltransferase involved in cell wall biosynthesis